MIATTVIASLLALTSCVSAHGGHNAPRRADHVAASQQLAERGTAWNTPDHPDWYYLNGLTW